MSPAILAAGALAALPALAAALGQWPSEEFSGNMGCPTCRREVDDVVDNHWMRPEDLSKVHEAGREGGLSSSDADRMLDAIRDVGQHHGSFLVTVTDGGMLDMAANMIQSLDAVPCQAPRLIIGMGPNICQKFAPHKKTICVEVFQDTGSEDEVDWGSHAYWQVVFRKHVVLTMVAMSQVARHVVYTDPDIVFLDCPVRYLVKHYENTHDVIFSPNNMLAPNAENVEDVAETYETRGMSNITVGPHGRHADINTGLFLMASSRKVGDLMLKTMRIFKEQEFVHGHYQQFSLVKALDEVPDLRIGVARGDRLVNGNVFWGHRDLLRPAEVVSVHANWMQSQLKVPCLKQAGLWGGHALARKTSLEHWDTTAPAATMDDKFATVESCGGDARAEPPRPARPGCYLWLPTGCKAHVFRAKEQWRWVEDLTERDDCQEAAKNMYNKWCGVDDARTLFVAAAANPPAEPAETGCYVWMPGGCASRSFHAQTSWRKASASDYPDRDSCTQIAPDKFNKWCGAADAQALWVPPPPDSPKNPGCYAFLPTGCNKKHRSSGSNGWIRDTVAEQSLGARADRSACEGRKEQIDAWCGTTNARMEFVK